jgi:hypothetical protein
MPNRLLLCALLFLPLLAQPYPQRIRTFYPLDSPEVPRAVLGDPAPFPMGGFRVVIASSDDAVWMGGPEGVVRFQAFADLADQRQYFAGRRYLPDDDVRNIVPDLTAGVWVRTRTGIAHLEYRPMNLAEKAAFFERRVSERHDRYGMVAASSLREPGNLATNQTESSDNDGLWTAMYAAAECFRYKVTQSPESLALAKKATEAVLFLEQITGHAGFPARSYIRKGEAQPSDGVWNETPDGQYVWKGDTSSDEIVGHFYIFSVAWDLLPDAALKERIASKARRIMDHILTHGYNLVDVTGKPTTWGMWSNEYFIGRGRSDSPLNALELLSFLKTAAHITGDAKYAAEYRKVAFDLGYAKLAARELELRREINYSDEELAMLSFYPLFRYETDPQLVSIYRRALEGWWENMRREKNPLWTYIYQAANPKAEVDRDAALWMLRRIPLDLVSWTVKNSNRKDNEMEDAPDRHRQRQTKTLLPPDERPVMKWNDNPFQVDGGNGGRNEDDGTFFLLPYWMGRCHEFLAPLQ